VKETERVGFEFFLVRLVALDLRQPADAVALKAPVQRRARQMRDRVPQRTVNRRAGQLMISEGDDDRLFLDAERRRGRRLGPHGRVGGRSSATPFGDSLRVGALMLS
jgi:hypothetical protein